MSGSQAQPVVNDGGIRLWRRSTIDLPSTLLLSTVKRRRFEMLAGITRKSEEIFLHS